MKCEERQIESILIVKHACTDSNEQEIGPVFESFTSGETPRIDRSELWITSKLWCTFWRREAVRLACELSVKVGEYVSLLPLFLFFFLVLGTHDMYILLLDFFFFVLLVC